MASFAAQSNTPSTAYPDVFIGSQPPGKGYRLTGLDNETRKKTETEALTRADLYARTLNPARNSAIAMAPWVRGPMPTGPDYTKAFRWEKEPTAGSTAKPSADASPPSPPPPPPSQAMRDARQRSELALNRSVRTPNLDDRSNPNYYANLGNTFTRNANRVDQRYAKYFKDQSALQTAEIGYSMKNAIRDLPSDLRITNAMAPQEALELAKAFSEVATLQPLTGKYATKTTT